MNRLSTYLSANEVGCWTILQQSMQCTESCQYIKNLKICVIDVLPNVLYIFYIYISCYDLLRYERYTE